MDRNLIKSCQPPFPSRALLREAPTCNNGGPCGLGTEHDYCANDDSLPVRRFHKQFFPRDLIALVDLILLDHLLILPEGKDVIGVGLISVESLHHFQCFLLTLTGYHCLFDEYCSASEQGKVWGETYTNEAIRAGKGSRGCKTAQVWPGSPTEVSIELHLR